MFADIPLPHPVLLVEGGGAALRGTAPLSLIFQSSGQKGRLSPTGRGTHCYVSRYRNKFVSVPGNFVSLALTCWRVLN